MAGTCLSRPYAFHTSAATLVLLETASLLPPSRDAGLLPQFQLPSPTMHELTELSPQQVKGCLRHRHRALPQSVLSPVLACCLLATLFGHELDPPVRGSNPTRATDGGKAMSSTQRARKGLKVMGVPTHKIIGKGRIVIRNEQ
jgi:hypothetical protein